MESDLHRAGLLCRRYFDAAATDAEEQELRTLLGALPREALTTELRAAAAMLGGFTALRQERMPENGARLPQDGMLRPVNGAQLPQGILQPEQSAGPSRGALQPEPDAGLSKGTLQPEQGAGLSKGTLRPEQGAGLPEDELPVLPASENSRRRFIRNPADRWKQLIIGAGIAAAVALGLFLTARPTVYGYIDGRAVTDPAEALAATVYFEPLDGLTEAFDIADELLGTDNTNPKNTSKQ